MQFTFTPTTRPFGLTVNLTLDDAEVRSAFTAPMDDEERQSFSDAFSPAQETLSPDTLLHVTANILARVIEAATATDLNLTASPAELK